MVNRFSDLTEIREAFDSSWVNRFSFSGGLGVASLVLGLLAGCSSPATTTDPVNAGTGGSFTEPTEPATGGTASGGGSSTIPNAPDPVPPSASIPPSERTDIPPDSATSCEQLAADGGCQQPSSAGFCNVTCGRYLAQPINPNASEATKTLLNYLYSIYGQKVLSGQQERSWDNPEGSMQFYKDLVGDYPAVLGSDFLYPDGTTDRAIAYAKAGGIVMLRYHMGAPPQADTFEASKGDTNMASVLSPGTSEYQSLIAKLDYAAAELQRLEDQNIPVIWAPYHEFQPKGWFWWAKGSAEQFRDLWELTYSYLTNDKGLDNLIWLAPFSHNPDAAWLPEHFDLAGPDRYENPGEQPFTALYDEMLDIVPTGIPIPLHETGRIPQPAAMFSSGTHWLLWCVWAGYQRDTFYNTTADIITAYADERTITRSEVPPYR